MFSTLLINAVLALIVLAVANLNIPLIFYPIFIQLQMYSKDFLRILHYFMIGFLDLTFI